MSRAASAATASLTAAGAPWTSTNIVPTATPWISSTRACTNPTSSENWRDRSDRKAPEASLPVSDRRSRRTAWPGWAAASVSMRCLAAASVASVRSDAVAADTMARVTSWRGCANTSRVLPISTTSPCDSTATRSQTSRTTSIWCVIMTTVTPVLRLMSRSKARMLCVVSGSSAEVASSLSSTSGSLASARAMPTRCFWPPLIWLG